MIAFHEALEKIVHNRLLMPTQQVMLKDALGRIISEDIRAPLDLPPFDNSAVDGFAIFCEAVTANLRLKRGELIRAQRQYQLDLQPKTALKIMTGAPLPRGANAVAMVEDVIEEGDELFLKKPIGPTENIRFRGEDIVKGDCIAKSGDVINPQFIALVAGLGKKCVPVFRPPRVSIIATGDELVLPGEDLQFGQVYCLMEAMLKAQCAALAVEEITSELVADDEEAITSAIKRASSADIVVITGGMSKGDYDFARRALLRNACEEIFYQGAWRPGKPLYFGKKNETLFFGLPGNPVAAFVCFHVFVKSAILASMNAGLLSCTKKQAMAANDFKKKPGFTFLARARVDDENRLEFLAGQSSHQIFSLSKANALCVVPQDVAMINAGQMVHYLPL